MSRPARPSRKAPVLIGLFLVGLFLWIQHADVSVVRDIRNRLEWLAYDLRLDLTRPFAGGGRDDIVIVDIDEESLEAEGHWPWPRTRVADLVTRLFEAGAVVVGMDTIFAESERNIARTVKRRLREIPDLDPSSRTLRVLERAAPHLDGDRDLARTLRQREVVLAYLLGRTGTERGALGPPLPVAGLEAPEGTAILKMDDYLGNLPRLQEAATSGGFSTIIPSRDGILRRYHLILRHGGEVYPSLALEMARLYLLAEEVGIATSPIGEIRAVDRIDLDGHAIPTGGAGSVLIPYRGEGGSFPYVSATDVLSGEVGTERLAGKLVLVGSSAQGLNDLRATPVQAVFPGVEVHATVLAGILQRSFPRHPSWAEGANFIFMLLTGLALALWLPRLRPLPLAGVTLGLATGLTGANVAIWTLQHWVLPLALPLAMLLGLGTANMAYGFLVAERSRRQLKDMFGQYVPPALVEELSRDPEGAASMEGERRDMTVLFADIRGFTTISETLSAAALKDLLNRFFTPMTRIIFGHRGTIDKYVGDMIMAFWGAPLEDPEHARHGVRAALAMRAEAARLGERFAQEGLPPIEIGVGLSTGPMNVGNMGSAFRRSYTVLGDTVNLGARLEGLTKFYGAGIIVGEATRDGLEEEILFRPLDRVQVKGKQ